MSRKTGKTFEQILTAAIPANLQSLENKAHTASSLAVTYPKNEAVFREIENEALRKIFQILISELKIEDVRAIVSSPCGRLAAAIRLGD
jgi:hypothetical protein